MMIALEDERTREGFDDVLQPFIRLSLNILGYFATKVIYGSINHLHSQVK